jgi:hypothetical protein
MNENTKLQQVNDEMLEDARGGLLCAAGKLKPKQASALCATASTTDAVYPPYEPDDCCADMQVQMCIR